MNMLSECIIKLIKWYCQNIIAVSYYCKKKLVLSLLGLALAAALKAATEVAKHDALILAKNAAKCFVNKGQTSLIRIFQ